ncbi:MAG: lipase, partial [Thermoleophilaceae bacterium]|nr:lipase [Thermoleophilaceae bacterium]
MILHSHSWGDGPPVACVHGVTGHGERFELLARQLEGRRVVAFDLRGHGRSGYQPPWSLETHVADLAESARALGIERAPWVGFSFGGRLVADLALAEPDLVESLALLDPALQLPADFALEAAEEERSEETFASADEAIEARIATGTLVSTPRAYLEAEMRQHLEPTPDGRLRARYSRAAAIAAWGEMARPAPPPAPVPTLLVLGSESHVP